MLCRKAPQTPRESGKRQGTKSERDGGLESPSAEMPQKPRVPFSQKPHPERAERGAEHGRARDPEAGVLAPEERSQGSRAGFRVPPLLFPSELLCRNIYFTRNQKLEAVGNPAGNGRLDRVSGDAFLHLWIINFGHFPSALRYFNF